MSAFNFTGPIPDWVDPENEGWSFLDAAVMLGQDGLSFDILVATQEENRKVEALKGWKPEYGHSTVIPSRPLVMPSVCAPWWEEDDSPYRTRTTPYLVKLLLAGVARAFGDPGRLGAKAEWIPPRVWWGLRPRAGDAPCFEGDNCTYWNVRVMDRAAFLTQVEVASEIDAEPSPAPDATERSEQKLVPKGGRPLSNRFYAFAREMVRNADHIDGLLAAEDLFRLMRDWCDMQFPNEGVGDSTIRDWIAKLDYRRPEHSRQGGS